MANAMPVYLSLGSNIEREKSIAAGLDALAAIFGKVQISPVYESESVGFDGEAFFNLVALIHTTMPVGELVDLLHKIEANNGRVRGQQKFSSRTLDIDVLTYGDATGIIDGIELPRDEVEKYAFVLKPLVDMAADEIHPVLKMSYQELLASKDFSSQKLWVVPFTWPVNS